MNTRVAAIVTAGDRGAARAVHGKSKVYLEVGGRSLISRVVGILQHVPEISEVYVIGDAERLEAALGGDDLRAELSKPLHVLPQLDNLYNNAWEGFRCSLPDPPPRGQEPQSEAELDHQVLYLSGDLPFATPQEISEFVRKAQATGCDYAVGLTTDTAIEMFQPQAGRPGVEITYFNLREARLKQNNLHLARPARIGNRRYVQDMYEHRKQREIVNMLALAWRLLWLEQGGPSIVFFYSLIHIAGVFDRRGWRRLADLVRRTVSLTFVEKSVGKLMKTKFRFIVTAVGGCAVDVDTDEEYDVICENFETWRAEHLERAETIGGALPANSPGRRAAAVSGAGPGEAS